MLVKTIKSTGRESYREDVQIPLGAWAVILKVQTNLDEVPGGVGDDYVYNSENETIDYVGSEPEALLMRRTVQGPYQRETFIYWSHQPFLIRKRWETPLNGTWMHMATGVGSRGLTTTLPKLRVPNCFKSHADRHVRSDRPNKWCRLIDLAGCLNVEAVDLIRLHWMHFDGYDPGLHIVRAADAQKLADTEVCENVWTQPDKKDLLTSDLTDVWVRKRFALVVAYCNLVGWHTENLAKSA